MLVSGILLWSLAAILAVITATRPGQLHYKALRIAGQQALVILPRMPISVLAAGFIAVLLPQEIISTWIGSDSGFTGILIASLIGAMIPSGPVISFPVAIALLHLGAGVPQMIAFLTAWSTFAVHRLLIFEIPLMGVGFAAKRLLVSLVLPPVAALIAWGIIAV